jgi:crotonobetainyl-CoA:carnitine CoA-transferase CaiB-like acyl-CoA transferase
MFIPSGGSVLVDWGADVIKVEPMTGDPQRGLITSGLLPGGAGGVNFMVEQPHRGKRSIGLDLAHPDGREALLKLVETADVFLTNYLPPIRRKLRIDTDDIRARNPNIIIARGSGAGPKGPDAEKGGYDGASFWARGGMGMTMPAGEGGWPPGQPTAAFGDVMGGLATAGAIAAALVKRERTGESSVVDVSLLATAMWQLSPMVIASKLFGFSKIPQGDRTKSPNPGVGTYRTSDDRYIAVILLQSDKHWDDFVKRLGVPDMATDPKFCDSAARAQNNTECIARLDEAFGSQPLSYWTEVLADFDGVWSPFQTLDELYDDVQVIANGYLPPEHGEHTELLLMDLGYDWDQIAAMKESGAVL